MCDNPLCDIGPGGAAPRDRPAPGVEDDPVPLRRRGVVRDIAAGVGASLSTAVTAGATALRIWHVTPR